MQYKKRYINKKTKQHGIQLSYKELLIKIDETSDQFWNGSMTIVRTATIAAFEQALHDLAYAYNLDQFPVKKTDERADKWIVGFSNVSFDMSAGMFVINFKLIDSLPDKTTTF